MRVSLHHSSKYTKSTLPHCREPSLSSLAGEGRGIVTGLWRNTCYTSLAGLCADASLGTASAQTSHDCQGLVCIWWRPWVSGRAAPRSQYKYATDSKKKVVVNRVWLQAYVQSDPQAQNFVVTL